MQSHLATSGWMGKVIAVTITDYSLRTDTSYNFIARCLLLLSTVCMYIKQDTHCIYLIYTDGVLNYLDT